MSNLSFNDLVTIYKATEKVKGSPEGVIEISNEKILIALKKATAEENFEESGIDLEVDDPEELVLGQKHEITLGSPRTGLGIVVQNLVEFLDSSQIRMAEPKRYFILDENFDKDDTIVPDGVEKYRKILAFLEILKDSAAYTDTGTSELVFLHEGKFVIPVKYSKSVISNIDFVNLEKIVSFFKDDTHKEQKLAILSNAVLSLIRITARNRRFPTLLSEIAALLAKFSDGYKLFIADFSYDKIREQFEADKVEYSNRIHKVFSDIQSQLLSIPVATVIVATQMKIVKDGSGDLTNKALLAGAWVFAIIFCLLCYNQWKTLSTIESEIKKKEKKIEEEYEAVNTIFEKIFDSLHRRITQQYVFLGVVIFILAGGLFSTHVFYFKIQQENQKAPIRIVSEKPSK